MNEVDTAVVPHADHGENVRTSNGERSRLGNEYSLQADGNLRWRNENTHLLADSTRRRLPLWTYRTNTDGILR